MPDRRLLLVHAHPDDETIGTGATMARYAAEGAAVTLVTCTLGEEGEILVPALEHLAADRDDALGQHRIGELAAAMRELGVTDHRFLGGAGRWRDSGMMGTPPNDDARSFWRSGEAERTAALVAVVREVRPQVVVGYDPHGGYGHPDHIRAHEVMTAAVEVAADASYRPDLGDAWSVAKIYWSVVPRSVLAEGMARSDNPFGAWAAIDDIPFGVPDDEVTTRVDASAYLDRKTAAMRAHATQITVDGPFFALADGTGQVVLGREHYRLVKGALGGQVDGVEPDLFAGLG